MSIESFFEGGFVVRATVSLIELYKSSQNQTYHPPSHLEIDNYTDSWASPPGDKTNLKQAARRQHVPQCPIQGRRVQPQLLIRAPQKSL